MLLKDILISIVLFSLFITAAYIVVGTLYGSYGTTYTDMSNTFSKLNDTVSDVNTMQAKMEGSSVSVVGFLEYISTGAWESIKLVFNSGSIIKSVADDTAGQFNIPIIFVDAFIAVLMITIIFGVLGAVFRRAV